MDVFPDLYEPTSDNSIEHFLNNLYNPLQFANLQNQPICSQSLPVSPLSVLGGLQDPPYYQQKQQQVTQFQGKQQGLSVSRCTSSTAQSTTKFKKRKNQVKRVCQVPAEGTSTSTSDLWSWRKYGQKPIKGSPYPSLVFRWYGVVDTEFGAKKTPNSVSLIGNQIRAPKYGTEIWEAEFCGEAEFSGPRIHKAEIGNRIRAPRLKEHNFWNQSCDAEVVKLSFVKSKLRQAEIHNPRL
ncbi:WRKY domain-containing protein [Artemisia annua]|uniref:WRKY domain-containing protein n=1 Tax=Artemisia annua TaxID=35608 RepID=A0A2U1LT63_ARTAN|nr:WRKY domain-containing protein [Artemisia annua]